MHAADIIGTLNGDNNLGAACVWIRDDSGNRWELVAGSPPGYRFRFDPKLVLLDPAGTPVAHVGDVIGVDGTADPPNVGSFCMVGRLFRAEHIVFIEAQ